MNNEERLHDLDWILYNCDKPIQDPLDSYELLEHIDNLKWGLKTVTEIVKEMIRSGVV